LPRPLLPWRTSHVRLTQERHRKQRAAKAANPQAAHMPIDIGHLHHIAIEYPSRGKAGNRALTSVFNCRNSLCTLICERSHFQTCTTVLPVISALSCCIQRFKNVEKVAFSSRPCTPLLAQAASSPAEEVLGTDSCPTSPGTSLYVRRFVSLFSAHITSEPTAVRLAHGPEHGRKAVRRSLYLRSA